MIHAFIPAHETAVAHVFTWADQKHQVTTLPVVAWQMVPQDNGRYIARPVFTIDLGNNARIGIISYGSVITEDAIYRDQGAFERGTVAMLQQREGKVYK